jgi:hypothetical protein
MVLLDIRHLLELPMKKSIIAILISVAFTLVAAEFSSSDSQSSPDDLFTTFLPGRFSDFLVDRDGTAVVFPESQVLRRGARIWSGGVWKEAPELAWAGTVRDIEAVDQGRWAVLSQVSSTETALYEYSAGKLKMIGSIPGKFITPTLHPASDGTIWIVSREGGAYALKSGQVTAHRFRPEVISQTPNPFTSFSPSGYPAILSVDIPERGRWFWSNYQDENFILLRPDIPTIEGFHVYQDGNWRVVPHAVGRLGSAIPMNDKSIIACGRNSAGIFRIDSADGANKNMEISFPSGEDCVFLHQSSAGNLLMIDAFRDTQARERGGWFGQLLAIKNGQVQKLLDRVDLEPANYDKKRPSVEIPGGTLIAEAGTGLLFVSSDLGTVRRFDWNYGFPLAFIDRMEISGRDVYVLDKERGFAVFDYRRLLNAREDKSIQDWTILNTPVQRPVISPDGTVWRVSSLNPLEILRCAGAEAKAIPLAGSGLPGNLSYLATDTKNRLWLISTLRNRAAYLDNDVWRAFSSLEEAYATIASEEKGNPEYRIGSTRDSFYPAFAGDGRVACRNESGGISFFDGSHWDSLGRDSEKQILQEAPFYHKGILTVRMFRLKPTLGTCYYQYLNGAWETTDKIAGPFSGSPYGVNPGSPNYLSALPQDFPGKDPNTRIRLRDNSGAVWAGGFDTLWRGMDGLWTKFPIRNAPLQMAKAIDEIQVDRAGAIWFYTTGNFSRLFRYMPKNPALVLSWMEPPPGESKTGSFKLRARVTGIDKNIWIRRQIDKGDWRRSPVEAAQQDFILENLPNGVHTLRMQAWDELLRASNLLECRVTVTRDYEQEMQQWLLLLSSTDPSGRERAAKGLASIGRMALPPLTALEKEAKPEVKWWIRAIKEDIERREEKINFK